jgi:hypothetical protein
MLVVSPNRLSVSPAETIADDEPDVQEFSARNPGIASADSAFCDAGGETFNAIGITLDLREQPRPLGSFLGCDYSRKPTTWTFNRSGNDPALTQRYTRL